MFFTGTFEAIDIDNVNEAQFFANTVDTETVGMDIVLSWKSNYSFGTLSALLVGNFNNMYITAVNTDLDPDFFFGKREQSFLLASTPRSKFPLNLNYNIEKFNAGFGLTRFSEITLVDFDANEAKITVDLTVGYKLRDQLKLTIGGNNMTNEYLDQQDDLTEAGNIGMLSKWDLVVHIITLNWILTFKHSHIYYHF